MSVAQANGTIVVIDDSAGDITLLEEGLAEAGVHADVHREYDGGGALDYLDRVARRIEPRPCLVLIDINMPGVNGFEVLAALRRDARLAGLPCCILSTSNAMSDIARARALGADAYLLKPTSFDGYLALAEQVRAYVPD